MKRLGSLSKIATLSIITIGSSMVCASEILEYEHREMMTQYSSPYATEYNKVMYQGMKVYDKGDADVYFVESMLAHNIAALEMAQVQLKYGTDSQMRQLANEIIAAQKVDITILKQWLKEHKLEPIQGVPVPRAPIDTQIRLEEPVLRYPDLPTNVEKTSSKETETDY